MTAGRWRLALAAAGMLPGYLPTANADMTATGLSRCAAIASAEARLACYDALAGRQAPAAAPLPAPSVSAAPAAMPAAAPPAPPPAVSATSAPPADVAATAQNFGFTSAQLHTEPAGPKSIQARVASVTVDQSMRNFVVLDNGQTWLSTDGELQLEGGELVTIRRAALGSFMLASTQSKHSYHVRRVR